MDVHYEWLYGEGEKTTKREYSERYDSLVKLCGPIATIYDEHD